jgi:hypothetical protein
MRKILISPGYGAGWSSWHSGNLEEQKFALEYQPIIDFLEAGGKFIVKSHHWDERDPSKIFEEPGGSVLKQFLVDLKEKFGDTYFYLGGARQLTVVEISGRVKVTDYDGYESYQEEYDDHGFI